MIFATKYSFLRNITFFRFKEHLVHPFCFFLCLGLFGRKLDRFIKLKLKWRKQFINSGFISMVSQSHDDKNAILVAEKNGHGWSTYLPLTYPPQDISV